MHCASCEMLLEKEVQKIPNIKKVKASHKKGILEVEGDNISMQEVTKAVEKCGYSIAQKGENKTLLPKLHTKDFFQMGIIILIGFFVIRFFSYFEISRFFPDVDENVGIAVAFLLGITASVSTCLALTGGIVMSFSSQYSPKIHSFFERALPQIYFHIGRIGGFFLLGGLLGIIGGNLQYSTSFSAYLTIFVALIMLYMGLQILGIVPNITKFGFHLPKSLSNKITKLQEKNHPLIPAIIGILTFFLPCGFTQSMQLVAVASGGFWSGGLIMMVFALGTLPVLFSVGIGSSYSQKKDFWVFKKIVGIIILFFALYSFNSGITLIGSSFTFDFWKNNQATNEIKNADNFSSNEEVQTVTLNIDYTFEPAEFRIKKNVPVRFVINANRVSGCSNEVIIPRLNLSTGKLKNGDTAILEFTPTQSGNIPFSCWMGMIGGKFIVK